MRCSSFAPYVGSSPAQWSVSGSPQPPCPGCSSSRMCYHVYIYIYIYIILIYVMVMGVGVCVLHTLCTRQCRSVMGKSPLQAFQWRKSAPATCIHTMHPLFHASMHPSFHPSIHPSTIHLSILPSIHHASIHPSTLHPCINLHGCFHPCIHPSIHPSCIHPSIHPASMHPPPWMPHPCTHSSTMHPSIHPPSPSPHHASTFPWPLHLPASPFHPTSQRPSH